MPDAKYRVMVINLLLLLLSGIVLTLSCVSIITEATILLTNNDITKSLNRSSFPEGFIFGTASSAYQVLQKQVSIFYFSISNIND